MPITIALTKETRKLPYFSDFKEDEVEVPDKPFLRELLDGSLDPEALSIEELQRGIETSIYFSLDTEKLMEELLWKIGARAVDEKSTEKLS